MELQELRPGLWRWTTHHPEWRQDVGSVAYEGADDLVLIDPLLPTDDALDALVARIGKPLSALVTVFWHTRSAALVAAEPQELGRREPGQGAVPGELDQALRADTLLDLGALGGGPLVVPEDRRADHRSRRVDHDEPVHLAREADAHHRSLIGHLGERRR